MALGEMMLDPFTGPRLSVDVAVPPAPAPVLITLAGELDSEEVDRLDKAVAGLPVGDDRDVRIEASRLTFIDSAGIRALLTFRERAAGSGARVVMNQVSINVYRVMEIAALLDIFEISDPSGDE